MTIEMDIQLGQVKNSMKYLLLLSEDTGQEEVESNNVNESQKLKKSFRRK